MNNLLKRNVFNSVYIAKQHGIKHLWLQISDIALPSPLSYRLLFSHFSCKRFHEAQAGHGMFAEHHDAASSYDNGVSSGCRRVEAARAAHLCEIAPSMNAYGNFNGGHVR